MNNSLFAIEPTRTGGVWVFDDAARGLVREPFVGHTNRVIDRLVGGSRSPTLLFSSQEFPGWALRLDRVEADALGCSTCWRCHDTGEECWLCPALYLYFASAPESIWVAAQ